MDCNINYSNDHFFLCPRCHFISQVTKWKSTADPCPNCNAITLRRMYPDISAFKLKRMIHYFYTKVIKRSDDYESELLRLVHQKSHKNFEAHKIIDTAKEVHKLYENATKTEYESAIKFIKNHLDLQTEDDAIELFASMVEYSDTYEEHSVILILTNILLQNLFDEFLFHLSVSNGLKKVKARRKINRLPNFEKRCEVFQNETKYTLQAALSESSFTTFYDKWIEIQERQKRFLSGLSFELESLTVAKALNLVKNVVPIFAYLNNRFATFHKQTIPKP